jgi:hypothetical protein
MIGQVQNVGNPQNPVPMPQVQPNVAPNQPQPANAAHSRGVLAQQQPPDTGSLYPRQGPSLPQMGFEFSNKRAAQTATASAIMQDFTNFANMIEQREHQKKESEAEYYLRELQAAKDDKDWARFNMILEKPEVKKVLKEIKGYEPFEEKETPPGVSGAQKAAQGIVQEKQQQAQQQQGLIQKIRQRLSGQTAPPATGAVQATPSAEQQAAAHQGETANIIAQRQQQEAQDPATARAMAMGTPLSTQEQRQAVMQELGWLGMTPQQLQQANAVMQNNIIKVAGRLAEVDARNQKDLQVEYSRAQSDVQRAKIAAGPRYAAVKAMNDTKLEMMQAKDLNEKLKIEINGYNKQLEIYNKTIDSDKADAKDKAAAQQMIPFIQGQVRESQRQLDAMTAAAEFQQLGIPVMGSMAGEQDTTTQGQAAPQSPEPPQEKEQ